VIARFNPSNTIWTLSRANTKSRPSPYQYAFSEGKENLTVDLGFYQHCLFSKKNGKILRIGNF